MLYRLTRKILETKWRYLLFGSKVRVMRGGVFVASPTAILHNCRVYVGPKSKLIINENVKLDGVGLFIYEGILKIGDNSIFEKDRNQCMPEYIVDNNSTATIDDHVRLHCSRVWVRFGGHLHIASYTNINYNSEIRCDDHVEVGNFCQISYNTRIWDTNTHCKYPIDRRRHLAVQYFPGFGHETERPATSPVFIGNDCWLGENVAILKGCKISDGVTIGYGTLLCNKDIPAGATVVNKNELVVMKDVKGFDTHPLL